MHKFNNYLNRDFTIYRVIAIAGEYMNIVEFNALLFNEFGELSKDEIKERYGFINHEAKMLHVTKETGLMYGTYGQDDQWYIIPNERKDLLEFFNKQAPMKYLKRYKRLIGLEHFVNNRDNCLENFESYAEIYYVIGWKERRLREEKLKQLI